MANEWGLKQRTVGDLMTQNVLTIDQNQSAIEAAEFLIKKSISGAPVVNERAECVGVFSAIDCARLVKSLGGSHEQPQGCPFQQRHRRTDGSEVTLCILPPDHCPFQLPENEEGESREICQAPHEIVVEWQPLQSPLSPDDPVKRWMCTAPLTINENATVAECAKRMVAAKVHRLIIVDVNRHVVGLVSSIDLLKVLAE